MSVLSYKGYLAKVDYSVEDQIFYGQVIGMSDLVNFASEIASELADEFHKAVDEYIEFCHEVGKTPDKSYNSSFNVRLSPELHRQLSQIASLEGVSLNQVIAESAESKVQSFKKLHPSFV